MFGAPVSVDFRAKYGHDLYPVFAELLHRGLAQGLAHDSDFDTHILADLKDDFTPEPEPAVFVGEYQFPEFALQQKKKELLKARFHVLHAAAQVFHYQVAEFAGFEFQENLLSLQVRFLVVGPDTNITDDPCLGFGGLQSIASVMDQSAFWLGQFTLPLPAAQCLWINA